MWPVNASAAACGCSDLSIPDARNLSLSSGNVAADHPCGGYAQAAGNTMNASRLTVRGRSGAPGTERKDVNGVSRRFARIRVDSASSASSSDEFQRARARTACPKGGESIVTFMDLVDYLRTRFEGEKGQTMAEYGVVLAVITIGVFIALGALSGAISGAITTVTGYL